MTPWERLRRAARFIATVAVVLTILSACPLKEAEPTVKGSSPSPRIPACANASSCTFTVVTPNSLTVQPAKTVASFRFEGLPSSGPLSEWKDLNKQSLRFLPSEESPKPWVTFADEGIHEQSVVRFSGAEKMRFGPNGARPSSAVLLIFRSFQSGVLLSSADGAKIDLAPTEFPTGIQFFPGNDPAEHSLPLETKAGNRINDGRPHVIGFVRDANGSALFLDGSLEETRRYRGLPTPTTAWTLGNDQENSNGYVGDVGGIWFLEASITQEELISNMCRLMELFDIPGGKTSRCAH